MATGNENRVGSERRGGPARPASAHFPPPDRYVQCGRCVGEICFDCECRIVEIGGPDGLLLAWCECAWPEHHHEMEIVSGF